MLSALMRRDPLARDGSLNGQRTRIQISRAEHREDALASADLGVDHLGICPAQDRILAAHQTSLSVEDAKALLSELPEHVHSVLLFASPERSRPVFPPE